MIARLKKYLSFFRAAFTCVFGVLLTFFFTFFGWEDLDIKETCIKVFVLLCTLVLCMLISFVWFLLASSENIRSRGSGSISVRYGDLLNNAFRKQAFFRKKKQGLYVIPVNTHFDTIVEDETVANPLVTKNTLHGRWLIRYAEETGKSPQEIQDMIFRDLDSRNAHYENDRRNKGCQRHYAPGTCAIVKGLDNRNFLLLAISEFNQANNAHSTKDGIISCLHNMLEFINSNGQGSKCYVPLMGTGRSRAGLSHKESLHIILSTMDLYNEVIFSPIEIIIYGKDKNKVSIFDK